MSSPRIRIQVAALAFILLPAAAGVLAVHASATCERFVRTYVTTPVRNRVSRQTVDAWAKWRVGHPNWKPNPNRHRPKYVMTQHETVQKVAFACTMPTTPSTLNLFFTPADFDVPPAIVDLPSMATQISFPNQIPPEVAEVAPPDLWPPLIPFLPPILGGPSTPPGGTGVPPILPPVLPPIIGDTPEPASFLLVATGMGGFCLLLGAKGRRAHAKST